MDNSRLDPPEQAYFTLPLAALPMLRDSKKLYEDANDLIDLAIIMFAEHKAHPKGSALGGDDICMAWQALNVDPGSSANCVIRIENGAARSRWNIKQGIEVSGYNDTVLFSVRTRDLFALRDGDMPLKDFLVLAAIRSIIGIKAKEAKPRRITREQIAARIGGHSKKSEIIPQRRKMLLKESKLKQIGRIADKLAMQERFTKWTLSKRETWYHVSKTESEIADYVSERKSKMYQRKIEGLKAELKCTDKLKDQRDEIQALKEKLLKGNEESSLEGKALKEKNSDARLDRAIQHIL